MMSMCPLLLFRSLVVVLSMTDVRCSSPLASALGLDCRAYRVRSPLEGALLVETKKVIVLDIAPVLLLALVLGLFNNSQHSTLGVDRLRNAQLVLMFQGPGSTKGGSVRTAKRVATVSLKL